MNVGLSMKAVPGIIQSAFVVESIETAANVWRDQLNVGPFFRCDSLTADNLVHRGKPCEASISFALAMAGDLQIELIQLQNDAASVFQETVRSKGFGFHHNAVVANDVEDETDRLVAAGYELVSTLRVPSGRIAFLEDPAYPGRFLELVQESEMIRKVASAIGEASRGWDGSLPVRDFAVLQIG